MPLTDRSTNPMFGPNAFKLGLFAYAHDSAIAMTTAPERWRARWDDIEQMARMADRGGLDFLLSLARWKGWPGKGGGQNWNFDNLTTAAALATITKRIALISTLHTPLMHPVFAAKALTTIDHASHGRAGVNIVCGWNPRDFDMFGVKVTDHTDRYQQGEEWFALLKRILAGPAEEFDYDTPHFPGLKGVFGQPASVQQPTPLTISAAYSDTGREFAVRNVDFLLIGSYDQDGSRALYNDVAERSRRIGRTDPPGLLCMLAPYIRETKKEAEDFFKHFAVDHADHETIGNYLGTRAKTAATPAGSTVKSGTTGAAAGGIPLIGSPEDIVEQFVFIHKQGFSGATLTLPHFLDDLPIIIDRVLPLMEQAGLRTSVSAASPALDTAQV